MQVNENFFNILWPIPFFFHCPACHAGCIKICTDTFDTLILSYKRSKMRVIIIRFLTF